MNFPYHYTIPYHRSFKVKEALLLDSILNGHSHDPLLNRLIFLTLINLNSSKSSQTLKCHRLIDHFDVKEIPSLANLSNDLPPLVDDLDRSFLTPNIHRFKNSCLSYPADPSIIT